jgi:predicted secreted hydrolase
MRAERSAIGFQITFFRVPTPLGGAEASRFAARQLLFAHAAVSDLARGKLRHDQRIARAGFGIAEASVDDTVVEIGDWRLDRKDAGGASRYRARAAGDAAGFAFDLALDTTQPVLLQGDAGTSRKGPRREQLSRYYSEPQLARAAASRSTVARSRSRGAPGSTMSGATRTSIRQRRAGTGSASTSTTAAR